MATPLEADVEAGPPARRLSIERDDLLLLAASALAVPLGWVSIGWRWPLCVSGYDAWATALPLLQALAAAGGDWSALAYRPDLLGGTRLRDSVGPNPLVALLAGTGLHPTGVYDVAVFALQALVGFFGARTTLDLARSWGAPSRALSWPLALAAAVSCAFAPFLGWRVGYGHLAMTTGLLPFAATLALTAAAAARRTSVTLAAVAALAVADGLLFTGHQLVLYGMVFGTPLLLGIWLGARAPARALVVPGLAMAAGLLLALPALTGVFNHGLSGDAPRSPVGMRITYSYFTATVMDWITSLPWTRAAIPASRPGLFHHESNVPFGPLLALLVLVPWRRLRPLAWTAGVVAALVVALSIDLRPLSTLLIAVIPPLGSFRVPSRAALPLTLAFTPLALAALARALPAGTRPPERRGAAWLFGAGGFALLYLSPPLLREALGWTVALWLALRHRRGRTGDAALALGAVLALGGGAVGAFRERLLEPFIDTEAVLAEARALGAAAAAQQPDLRRPLVRVALGAELPELGANTAFAGGLSSLNGYFFPSRRLIALVAALRGQPYRPSAFVLRVSPAEPAAPVLFALYNVRWHGASAGGGPSASVPEVVPALPRAPMGPLTLAPLGPTAGPAWFSQRVAAVASVESLAQALRAEAETLARRAHATVWIVTADAATRGLPPTSGACASAAVTSVHASHAGEISAEVRTTGDCPLTLATNYAESLTARVRRDARWEPARTFPAYGALLGVWVPAGASEVAIGAR